MVFSNIRLSRCLDLEEEVYLENLKYVRVNDITMIGNEVAQLSDSHFNEINYWKVEDTKLILDVRDRQHFFIESLMYLIKDFFAPKNIVLNGYLFGVDELFGSFHCYYVFNNRVFVLPDMIAYFDGLRLDTDIHTNLQLVSKHMQELIKNNSS